MLCEKNKRKVKAIHYKGGYIVCYNKQITGRITKTITYVIEWTKY